MDGRRHWITWTLNKLVETITASLIPRSRQQDLWDLAEAQPPAYAFQAFDYTIHAIWDTTERALFPAVAIDRGPPPPEKRRKRFYNLPEGQRRSVLLFIIASFAYSGAAVRMLPQSAHIPFFAVLLQAALLGFALRL